MKDIIAPLCKEIARKMMSKVNLSSWKVEIKIDSFNQIKMMCFPYNLNFELDFVCAWLRKGLEIFGFIFQYSMKLMILSYKFLHIRM